MMANITKTLKSIVNGDNNFCCLCFNIYDAKDLICSKDEASIVRNNMNKSIVMSDLILTILGSDFTEYVETLENICEPCAKSLINCYTFIETCNFNATLLSNALDSLDTGIQDLCKPREEKSLFVSIKLNNFSCQFLYDNQNIFTPEVALKRFLVLNTLKKEEPISSGKTIKYSINDSDMLLNPSNKHIFQCKVCVKMYQSMLKLKNHFIKVHTDKNIKKKCLRQPKTYRKSISGGSGSHHRITCRECGNTYSNKYSLKTHGLCHKLSHIVCPDCGRNYKNQATFKNHLQMDICKQERRHSPTKGKYTCDYCGKKYTQKVSLRVHIQFEHNGNYKAHICEWCGKKFWAQSRLKAHIVKHTRERNFTCSICHGKFVTKESLLYHTRLHTGETPYKCSQCPSKFLSASRRADHVKRYHNGAKPGFECNVCQGKFRSAHILIKHRKTHENILTKCASRVPTMHQIKIDQYEDKYLDIKSQDIDLNDCSIDNFFV